MTTPDPLPIPRLTAPISGAVELPGSKSITNRALVCAALADGVSRLQNVLVSDDTEAMIHGITALGAEVTDEGDGHHSIRGIAGRPAPGPITVDARQSGTTSRFLAPVAALGIGEYTIDGADQLRARPFGDLVDALRSMGIDATATEGDRLPMHVVGARAVARRVSLRADVSSQFASGLLLAAPCLPWGLEIELVGDIVSQPYLDMTVAVMRAFGANVEADVGQYVVDGGGYHPREYRIEPDASTASYFFGLAAASGGRIDVRGLSTASLQGDVGFLGVLEEMGATIEETATGVRVSGPDSGLRGIDVNLADLSDTAPTLAAIAACAEGTTAVSGVGFIRNKESDRIAGPVRELVRLGIDATEEPDGFRIVGGDVDGGVVATYDDHRMAMAFTVLGLVKGGISIEHPDCVAKTFPDFFSTILGLATSSSTASESDPTPATSAARRVIAIDGPSGSGKSTVAKALADRLGLDYLDTGAMYRAVAFAALRYDVDPSDTDAVASMARTIDIDVSPKGVFVEGADCTVEIRGPEVTRAVSAIAANPEVRAELQARQREWATRKGGGVIEGRDIGSVVFPNARAKFFLTARSEVRAGRRAKEVTDLDYETVAADLVRRDTADSTREHNPLVMADDAVVIETSSLGIDAVVDHVVSQLPED